METNELNEMRNQIAMLHNKLNEQEIINDRMLRSIISTKTDTIKRKMIISCCCAIFVIISSPYSFHEAIGLSWQFIIATDMLMIYCMFREMMFKHMISDKSLLNCNMLEVARTMARFRKDYKRYTISNAFLIIPWLGWMLWELHQIHGSSPIFNGLAIAMCTGAFIGACIGLRMFFRIIDSASEIIRQIED